MNVDTEMEMDRNTKAMEKHSNPLQICDMCQEFIHTEQDSGKICDCANYYHLSCLENLCIAYIHSKCLHCNRDYNLHSLKYENIINHPDFALGGAFLGLIVVIVLSTICINKTLRLDNRFTSLFIAICTLSMLSGSILCNKGLINLDYYQISGYDANTIAAAIYVIFANVKFDLTQLSAMVAMLILCLATIKMSHRIESKIQEYIKTAPRKVDVI